MTSPVPLYRLFLFLCSKNEKFKIKSFCHNFYLSSKKGLVLFADENKAVSGLGCYFHTDPFTSKELKLIIWFLSDSLRPLFF